MSSPATTVLTRFQQFNPPVALGSDPCLLVLGGTLVAAGFLLAKLLQTKEVEVSQEGNSWRCRFNFD